MSFCCGLVGVVGDLLAFEVFASLVKRAVCTQWLSNIIMSIRFHVFSDKNHVSRVCRGYGPRI